MFKSRRKDLLFLSVLLITLFIGISMVSAANNATNTSQTTSLSSDTHDLVSTVQDTQKEETQIKNTNKTIKKESSSLKTSSNSEVTSWDELKTSVKNNGTYTLKNDLISNSKLTTNPNTNITIDGNGYTILFTNGEIQVANKSTVYINNVNLNGSSQKSNSVITNYGDLTIKNCSLSNFDISSINGGVIFSENSTLNCINNTFKDNTAKYDGAAIHINNGKLNCTGNTFENNIANNGGAIYINNGITSNIIANTFINNSASRYGGALYINGKSVKSENNIFKNNTGDIGIIHINDADLSSTNDKFTNNNVNYGTIYVNFGDLICNYDTFTNNVANREGCAIYTTTGSTSIITNSIFKDNLVKKGSEGGETLYLVGKNTLSHNTYQNTSIAFNTKGVNSSKNSYIYHENVLISGNSILTNPTYYDSDILSKSAITLHLNGTNHNMMITQYNGNTTFTENTIPADTYSAYETLSIAQSTYNNYKTNNTNFIINKQPAGSSINANNITYSDTLTVNGTLKNITRGVLNISIVDKDGKVVQSKNITINGTTWSTDFYYVDTGNYTAVVTYKNSTGDYENFTNNTAFHVIKCKVNVTVKNIVTNVYHDTNLVTSVIGLNGVPVNSGNIVFKLQNKTATGVNNTQKVHVSNGTATLVYNPNTIKNWTMQVVYSGNSNYEANTSNVAMLYILPRNLNVNIIVQNPQKGGNNVKLTAQVSDTNGTLIENGTVIFKINDVTLKDKQGNEIKAKITNGLATATYTLPDGMGAGNYKLTAVAAVKNSNRGENSTNLVIVKRDIIIKLNNITTQTGDSIKVTGKITDDLSHMLVGTNKVCVKINGKTVMDGNKTVYFYVNNGVINFTIPSKYTINLTAGTYNLTVVSGDRQPYNSGKGSTLLKIERKNITIKLNKLTAVEGKNIKVTGNITDDLNHKVIGTNKVCVKISDKTVMNQNKTVYFYVNNGVINFTIPIKYTGNLTVGTYNLTLVAGNTQRYNAQRNSTILTIKS